MNYSKKILVRFLFILLLFLIISIFVNIDIDEFFINTIYTVTGIFFSFGLGLIINFNFREVKNPRFIKELRKNRDTVRNSFIICFFINTFLLILNKFLISNNLQQVNLSLKNTSITLNFPILFGVVMIYSVYYYILNFTSFQKLNDDIFDKIDKEKSVD